MWNRQTTYFWNTAKESNNVYLLSSSSYYIYFVQFCRLLKLRSTWMQPTPRLGLTVRFQSSASHSRWVVSTNHVRFDLRHPYIERLSTLSADMCLDVTPSLIPKYTDAPHLKMCITHVWLNLIQFWKSWVAVSMTSSLPLAQAVFSTKVLMKLYTKNSHTYRESHRRKRETGDRAKGEKFIS